MNASCVLSCKMRIQDVYMWQCRDSIFTSSGSCSVMGVHRGCESERLRASILLRLVSPSLHPPQTYRWLASWNEGWWHLPVVRVGPWVQLLEPKARLHVRASAFWSLDSPPVSSSLSSYLTTLANLSFPHGTGETSDTWHSLPPPLRRNLYPAPSSSLLTT